MPYGSINEIAASIGYSRHSVSLYLNGKQYNSVIEKAVVAYLEEIETTRAKNLKKIGINPEDMTLRDFRGYPFFCADRLKKILPKGAINVIAQNTGYSRQMIWRYLSGLGHNKVIEQAVFKYLKEKDNIIEGRIRALGFSAPKVKINKI